MPSRDETTFDHARAGSAYLGAGHSVSGGRFFGLLVLREAVLRGATRGADGSAGVGVEAGAAG